MEKYFPEDRIILTGNPVRQDLLDKIGSKEEAIKYFNLIFTPKHLYDPFVYAVFAYILSVFLYGKRTSFLQK